LGDGAVRSVTGRPVRGGGVMRNELLAKHYEFTEEELDFIINYDIKYRMGDELNAE